MYVILGCGGVGARVAQLLIDSEKTVHIVEADATRVEALQERKFHVVHGDMTQIDFRQNPFRDAEAFMILARNDAVNLRSVAAIKKALPETHIIARASNQGAADELKNAGATFVVQGSDIVGSAVVKELNELERVKQTDKLLQIIKDAGDGGLGVFLHDSPDPDSIAAGLALQRIAETVGVKGFIYYGGKIGHQQNKTLVNLLGARMKQITGNDDVRSILKRHSRTAILDCEIAGQNNCLPRDHVPSIVIGHHHTSADKATGDFVDVRQNVGAVSTILLGYLQELGLIPDPALATALLHAIRVDTAGLMRHTSPSDLKAVAYLSPLIDQNLLEKIESPPMTNDTLDVMGRAILDRHQRGAYLVTNAGFISERDALPQAADFLLNLEGINAVLVFGIEGEFVHLSGRSNDTRINMGEALQRAFGETNAGGHVQSAGGRIPLGILGSTEDRDELLSLVEKEVVKRFYAVVGAPELEHEDAAIAPDAEPEADAAPKGNGSGRRRKRRSSRAR